MPCRANERVVVYLPAFRSKLWKISVRPKRSREPNPVPVADDNGSTGVVSPTLLRMEQEKYSGDGLSALQMFVEPRHDLDEVAGHVPVVELLLENSVPGVAAGAGRSRQDENEG